MAKIHKTSKKLFPITSCGITNYGYGKNSYTAGSANWNSVTCESCLKFRSKRMVKK